MTLKQLGSGNDKEEVAGATVMDQVEADFSLQEPSSLVAAKESNGDSGHRNSSLREKAGQGDGNGEERISSSRLYGYEDADQSMSNGGSGRPNQRMTRRNVVTAEAARFEMSYHPGRVHLYAPPRQRQKWGETQVLPRINWGDLFFDLHYVAATYNISNILVSDATPLGYLYAAGTFFPILQIWMEQAVFSSRFVNDNDVAHGVFRILTLLVLATAVLNIRPVDIMSHSSTEISMFVFCLCLGLERCLTLLRYVELYCFGVGQTKVIQKNAIAAMCMALFLFVFYIAAMTVAAMKFFPRQHADKEYHRLLADATAGFEKDAYQAAAVGEDSTTHLPIILCLAGVLLHALGHIIFIIFFFATSGSHKKFTVPINVGFVIHRNGEWISLMLGESIFSLLIVNVPNENSAFFTTFYFGILTVMLLQYLHFQSLPHDPDSHAMRRNKNAGVLWANTNNIYSFALVCLGAAYTYFLTDFEDNDIGEGRRLGGDGAASELDDDVLRWNASILFSASLALIFVCLDVMILLHLGIQEARDRLVSRKQVSYKGFLFVFLRPCLTIFAATLWMWDNNPKELSVIGFCCVLAQLSLRKIGSKYMTHEQCHFLDPAYQSERRLASRFGEQSSASAAEQVAVDESSSSDKEPANA